MVTRHGGQAFHCNRVQRRVDVKSSSPEPSREEKNRDGILIFGHTPRDINAHARIRVRGDWIPQIERVSLITSGVSNMGLGQSRLTLAPSKAGGRAWLLRFLRYGQRNSDGLACKRHNQLVCWSGFCPSWGNSPRQCGNRGESGLVPQEKQGHSFFLSPVGQDRPASGTWGGSY